MLFCWIGRREADGTKYSMAVPMPPRVMIGSKNASTVYSGLHDGKWQRFVDEFCNDMQSIAVVPMEFRETDKGSQCDKMTAYEPTMKPRKAIAADSTAPAGIEKRKISKSSFVLYSCHFCNLHQGQLDIGNVAREYWVDRIDAISSFMRSGSAWTRGTLSVIMLLDTKGNFEVAHYPPSRSLRGNFACRTCLCTSHSHDQSTSDEP